MSAPQNRAASGVLELTVPMRTINPLNTRENPFARAKRVKKERQGFALWFLASGWPPSRLAERFASGCIVTFTRRSPKMLDDDAVPAASKAFRDELARMLGITDGPTDKRAQWRYAQEIGPFSMHVRIERVPVVELRPKLVSP